MVAALDNHKNSLHNNQKISMGAYFTCLHRGFSILPTEGFFQAVAEILWLNGCNQGGES